MSSNYADSRQEEISKRFPNGSVLATEEGSEHFLHWVTFFRRNIHRLATDYLGLRLHLFQIIMLYMMGISRFFVTIASRASSKSFIIAIFACCECILYPGLKVVIASATRGQSKLIVSEKIQKELMPASPALRKEIDKIKDNQNEVVVFFKNHSTITVVTAGESGRGYRSNLLIRDEYRMIDEGVDNSILSPFQIIRQVPYMQDPEYADVPELQEETTDIYISSSWYDTGKHWMWKIADQAYEAMLNGKRMTLLAFDEAIAIKHKIKTMSYFQTEKRKQDPLTWRIEFLNERLRENRSAFFTYGMLQQNQNMKRPWYPRTLIDFKMGKKNPYDIQKQPGEIRIVACDMAFVTKEGNDNSVFSCIRLLPERTTYKRESQEDLEISNGYRRKLVYLEAIQGGDVGRQARRIRQLFADFGSDYLILDTRNAGRDAA